MFGLFKKDIAVLDVTSRLISAIIGIKNAQSVFNIKAIAEKQHQGYADGEWFDQADTANIAKEVLKDAMKNASSRTRKLFVSVPAEFATVVCKQMFRQLDRRRHITDGDIDDIIESGSDFSTDEYVIVNTSPVFFTLDGEDKLYSDIRGLEANRIEACMSYMLAKRSYVEMFDSIAEELGFDDVRYVLSDWAEAMGLIDAKQRDGLFVLIDVGYLSSSVSIGNGDGLIDMKSFSMGGGHIAGDIFEYLNVPFEMAEDAKRLVDLNMKYGDEEIIVSDGENTVYATHAQEIVKIRLDMFAEVINDILKQFQDSPSSRLQIFLTGEGIASMRGVKKYMSDSLIRYVEILAPKLPGFVRPDDSSKAALIMMADMLLNNVSMAEYLRRLFNGGKNK